MPQISVMSSASAYFPVSGPGLIAVERGVDRFRTHDVRIPNAPTKGRLVPVEQPKTVTDVPDACDAMNVRVGADRVDVPYVWPRTLRVPQRPPTVVYLDLNHWISLSKAHSGHSEGPAYSAARRLHASGSRWPSYVPPVGNDFHRDQQDRVPTARGETFARSSSACSAFAVVTSRSVVAAHEFEEMLDRLVGPSVDPVNLMDYLDWGVARAFGTSGELQILSDGVVVTEQARRDFPEGPEAFDRRVTFAEVELQRSVLDGPCPEEEPELRAAGWKPEAVIEVAERRAARRARAGAAVRRRPSLASRANP